MGEEIRLRAAESRGPDSGRGWVRIDDECMKALGIVARDIVELRGKRVTAAIAWPAYQMDQGMGIIRVDGLIRKNAGVVLEEYITVRKAAVKEAKNIVMAPVDMRLEVNADFDNFVKGRLLHRPLVEDDYTFVGQPGSATPLLVVGTDPQGIVIMTPGTNVTVVPEPTRSVITGLEERKKMLEEELDRLNKEIERLKTKNEEGE